MSEKPEEELPLHVDGDERQRLEALAELVGQGATAEQAAATAFELGLPLLEARIHRQAARNVGDCPGCAGAKLVAADAGEVRLQACIRCGGMWLDTESARQALAKVEPQVLDLAARATANAREPTGVQNAAEHCPVCRGPIAPHEVAGVALQRCERHGVWFDRGELLDIAQAMQQAAAKRAELDQVLRSAALDVELQQLKDLHDSAYRDGYRRGRLFGGGRGGGFWDW